jgi:hypothetical protein
MKSKKANYPKSVFLTLVIILSMSVTVFSRVPIPPPAATQVDATDALLICEHFVGMQLLPPSILWAADVNNSGGANSIDALLVMKSYVRQDPPMSGGIGDVIVSGGLNSGTVNVSIPAITNVCPDANGMVTIPVRITSSGPVAAISLALQYDQSALSFVQCFNLSSLLTSGGLLLTNANGGEVRLGWFNFATPVTFANECIVNLLFSCLNTANSSLTWNTQACRISDLTGQDFSDTYINGLVSPVSNYTATSNSPLCEGSKLHLYANPAGATYTWAGPAGYSSTQQNPFRNGASLSYAGIYYLTATIGNCTITSNTQVAVNAKPTKPGKMSDIVLCTPLSSTQLNGTVPLVGTGAWTQVSGPGSASFDDLTLPNATVSNLVSGNYAFRWTISNPPCPDEYKDVKVKVKKCKGTTIENDDFLLLVQPNPFSLSTTFYLDLPGEGLLTLRLFDLLGREVLAPVKDKFYPPGAATFNIDGSGLPEGMYMYRFTYRGTSVTQEKTGKLVLAR